MDISELNAAMRETLFQFRVNGLRPRDISQELKIPPQTASARLCRMESRGLIAKRVTGGGFDRKYRKQTDYWLTDEGARVLAELREIYQPQP